MNKEIETMISQFSGNLNRLSAMTGASGFVTDDSVNSLRFKFKMCKKANICRMFYDYNSDTYNMEFFKVKKGELAELSEVYNGLYGDQLRQVFVEYTGLDLIAPRLERSR